MDVRTIFLTLALGPSLAFAATPTPPLAKEAPAAAETATAEKKTCETRREVGSQRVKRVCLTESERIAEREKAARALNPGGRCSNQESYCDAGL